MRPLCPRSILVHKGYPDEYRIQCELDADHGDLHIGTGESGRDLAWATSDPEEY